MTSYSGIVGLILTSAGFTIISVGFILAVHYDKRRFWYLTQLEKSAVPDEPKAALKMANKILQEYVDLKSKKPKLSARKAKRNGRHARFHNRPNMRARVIKQIPF